MNGRSRSTMGKKGLGAAVMMAILVSLVALVAAQRPAAPSGPPAQLSAGSPEALLGQALHQEEIEGNLQAAIATYQQVLKAPSATRAQKARAQFRIGACYERLGVDGARKAYEAVVANYGDQSEFATQAKARLGAMGQASVSASREPVARLLWAKQNNTLPNPEPERGGVPSPDGKYLVYTGGDAHDLYIYENASGTSRRLTSSQGCLAAGPECEMSAYSTAWSPDGTRIAFSWMVTTGAVTLQVVSADGTGQRVLLPDGVREVEDWSPDGRTVLVTRSEKAPAGQSPQWGPPHVVAVSVADGAVQMALPASTRPAGRARYSPDGRHIAYQMSKGTVDGRSDVRVVSAERTGDAVVLDEAPSASLVGWTPDGAAVLFLSDRGSSIGLWTLPIANGAAVGAPRLVKGDLGPVDPGCVTVVTRDGSVYYSVRGSTSDVYLATLSTTGETLVAPPSNAGLASVGTSVTPAWSPDGKTLVFLSVSSVNPREASTLNTLNVDTGARRRVTLSEPVPVVGGAYGVAGTGAGLTFLSQLRDTRDGARSFGSIDVGTGEVTRRFSGIYPIELSGDGLRAYRYRSVVDGTSKARVLTVTDLGSQTSQELCRNPEILGGGSRIGVSPDGRSFVSAVSAGTKLPSPVIKVLQVATCTWTEVHRTVEPVDVYDVAWSSDATRIFFSTQDWSDAHKHQLWSIPAAGGKPTLYDVNIGLINRIAVHPDGRRLALDARRNEPRQLWVLERFLPPAKAQAKKRP